MIMDVTRILIHQVKRLQTLTTTNSFTVIGRSYHGHNASRVPSLTTFLPLMQPSATPFDGQQSSFGGNNMYNSIGGIRTKISQIDDRVAKRLPGGVHYHGFTYFPRPGEVDPPYAPSKLFMVKRKWSMKQKPWWDRKIIHELGLDKRSEIAIIKNTPENNKKLYKVKHLVEIIPITFPNGFPKDATSGFLKENGEFQAYSDIGKERVKNLDEHMKSMDKLQKLRMDGPTLKERLRHRWFSRYDANI